MKKRVTQLGQRRLESALETGHILRYLIAIIVVLVFASGLAMWIVDRHDFPTLGLALWWAVETVTTVGYGDVAPVEPAGRVLASLLMITGFASLSLLSGIIASLLVHKRAQGTSKTASEVDAIDRRLAAIEQILQGRAE